MLIVLGSAPLLAKDEDWAALMEHSMRHGAYVGPSLPNLDPVSGRGISALEAAAAAEALVVGVRNRQRPRTSDTETRGLGSYDSDASRQAGDDDEVSKAMALVVGRMTAAALLDDDDEGWT